MWILTISIPVFWRRTRKPPGPSARRPTAGFAGLKTTLLRILYGEGVRRRILKRMCYLNPQRYQEFRNPFIRSAFQVVDCPPLTSRGKTSTDIHLVMDCMDDLSHSTHFDEFIILSGDADFTPLLIRLQEHARRTLVLSVGYSSPAYTAAASWRIREDWFLQQALKDDRSDDEDTELPARAAPAAPPNNDEEEDDSASGNR